MVRELTQEEFWLVFKDVLFTDEKIEEARDEVEGIIQLGSLEQNQKILDIPCGVGRHTSILEQKGFDVVGVEKTDDYAKDAEQKTESSEILNQDMSNFRREKEFDAALNWWNSFGYFEDEEKDLQMLENIHASLKDGGVLLMDVYGKEIAAMNGFSTHWSRESDAKLLEDHEIKDDWNKVENTWIKVEDGEEIKFTWQQTLYSARELRRLLKKAGFQDIKFYGSLEKEPYNHEAERMILKAQKEP